MKISFYRNIAQYMNERTDEIVNSMAANNLAFREMTQKIISILDAIQDSLPAEHKKLLEELEDIQGRSEHITYKTLYRYGLKDGIRLCVLFDMLK